MDRICFVLLALIAISCKKGDSIATIPQTSPQDSIPSSNKLVIRTDTTFFNWTPSESYPICFINSTLTSVSADTFYAKLFDAFQIITDESPLFVAVGSDAYIEKLEPDNAWHEKQRAILIEGVRVGPIRPFKAYRLEAFLQWPVRETGTFRLRVNYYPSTYSIGRSQQLVDYSNYFTIQ